MNLNKVFVLGRLTKDPERRSLPSGQPVASFGVATNRYFVQNGEKKEETEFHNVVVFGKLAEIACQYLKKGSLALFEGRLRTRAWQDSSGAKHYRTEIIAQSLQLGPRIAGQPVVSFQGKTGNTAKNVSDEEIPVIEENAETNPGPKKNPIPDDQDEEIDVKEIPF